jgi:hypothetical protein
MGRMMGAVEAGAQELLRNVPRPANIQRQDALLRSAVVLRAAEPIIRERIAADIESEHIECKGVAVDGWTVFQCSHVEDAHIARGTR